MTNRLERSAREQELESYNARVLRGEKPPIAAIIWYAVRDRFSKEPHIVRALESARKQYKLILEDPAIRKWTLDEINAYLAGLQKHS